MHDEVLLRMFTRRSLIGDYESGRFTPTELARKYVMPRQKVYKWIDRWEDGGGLAALLDRPPIARTAPHRTSELADLLLLTAKGFYEDWGPRKLRELLVRCGYEMPAASTCGAILARHGQVTGRRGQRRFVTEHAQPLRHAKAPNDVWCVDFKGDFLLGNGRRCYPLTITDAYSRFIIDIRALPSIESSPVKAAFAQAFLRYGMPRSIRSDNGTPFSGANALAGLSSLSAWFIQLGIWVERIEPGKPQQNGRHERMHGTLVRTPKLLGRRALASQQRAFDAFRVRFNEERPHEGIGMRIPAELYSPSERRYPKRLPSITYPPTSEVRLVASNGCAMLDGRRVFVSHALAGHRVAFTPTEGEWSVSFGPLNVGRYVPGETTVTSLQDRRDRPRHAA